MIRGVHTMFYSSEPRELRAFLRVAELRQRGVEFVGEIEDTGWSRAIRMKVLLVTGGGPTEDKPDVLFETPSDPNRVPHAMTIRVPDCEGAYSVLKNGAPSS